MINSKQSLEEQGLEVSSTFKGLFRVHRRFRSIEANGSPSPMAQKQVTPSASGASGSCAPSCRVQQEDE